MSLCSQRRLALAIGVLLVAPVGRAAAPVPDTPFDQRYRDAFIQGDGEENDVHSIAVAPDGCVWTAGAAGVRRIENGRFVEPAGANPHGPAHQIKAADDGAVWIAAWNGVYAARDGRVEPAGEFPGPVTALSTDAGRILAASPAGVFEWKGGRWSRLNGEWATSIRDVAAAEGEVFVATDVGLFHFDGQRTQRWANADEITSSTVRRAALQRGRDGEDDTLWVATNAGIDRFERSEGGWRRTLWVDETGLHPPADDGSPDLAGLLASVDIRSLALRDGQPGLAARRSLVLASPVGVLLAEFSSRPDSWRLFHSLRWLPSDEVRDAAIDQDGTIWAATAAGASAIRRKTMTLAEKAEYFESVVRARHVRPPGLVERCVLERPGDLSSWTPVDTDNDGQYTGTYLVAEAYRWAATGDPSAKRNAQEAFAALEFLQTVTGTKGFLARTVVPAHWTRMADPNLSYSPQERARLLAEDPRERIVERRWRLTDDLKWLWKGDASSDEMTGHFYAWGVYHDLVAEGDERARVADLARRVMDYIIEGGYVFRDLGGEPTRWGVWSPEKLNGDPNWRSERGVNSVEILSYLTTARHMTGDEKYDQAIESLLWEHGYARNILEPRPSDVGGYTHIDDELLPMAYRALLAYERDEKRRELYERSLRAWFATVRDEASPYYNFEFAWLAKESGDAVLAERCVELLRDVPLDQIDWTVDNTRRADVRLVRRPVADDLQTDRLPPPGERPIFKWDSNPYRAAGGSGGRSENCPAFWLWPYWLARYHGLIGPPPEGPKRP